MSPINVGDTVKLIIGPYKDREALVTSIDYHTNRYHLRINSPNSAIFTVVPHDHMEFISAAPKTSFQVNDRVLIASPTAIHGGSLGTIRLVYPSGEYGVEVDRYPTQVYVYEPSELIRSSSAINYNTPPPAPTSGCQHKWVMYQPFRGESYECCANAGCGITYENFVKEQNSKKPETTSLYNTSPWGISTQGSKL